MPAPSYGKQTAKGSSPTPSPGLEGNRTIVYRVLSKPEDFPSEFLAWLPRWLGQNANFIVATTQLPAPESRRLVRGAQNAQFENSWVNFGGTNESAHYYKDPFGRVYVGGCVKGGTVTATIFTLPAGYRPQETLIYAVNSNNAFGYVTINPDGTVVATSGNNTFFSLSGISFRQFA